MTVGIYALYWAEPDLVYIGQSRDINTRIRRHTSELRSNKHKNLLMQQTWNTYGKPECITLDICSEQELEYLERYYIKEFDSCNTGLNITLGSGSVSGTTHGSSKYSKRQILKVLALLLRNNLDYASISNRTRVSIAVIITLKNKRSHFWIQTEYPDKWKQLDDCVVIHKYNENRKTCVTLISPTGIKYINTNISEFVKENSHLFCNKNYRTIANGFYKLTSKVRSTYLGWKLG